MGVLAIASEFYFMSTVFLAWAYRVLFSIYEFATLDTTRMGVDPSNLCRPTTGSDHSHPHKSN